MRKARLVICDIDSTLVVKHQMLTPRARKVIDTLRERGTYFGLASGRPLFQIRASMEMWGYDDFDVLVGMNGASVWDGVDRKEYSYFQMKKEWIKDTFDLMAPFESSPSIYLDNAQVFLKEDDLKEYQRMFKSMGDEKGMIALRLAKGKEELYAQDNGKIMFRVDEKIMPQVEAWVAAHPNDYYTGFKTQPSLMEFCNKNISKAYGMEQFCKMHGFGLEDVAAFGDTTNDNEMIQAAGWGVCMANGSDDTKAIADEVTEVACDDDGWADYMEKNFI
ncbi:MAG: Cof-type HAD-IIB family hydrolase [Lachnospiraceae bacterium]|nr:Cof-type HAD-IIB family hydrolase [Lachnospiraceae bacterium]